ncbi:MAG TPA: polysaccharide deacetylase family protein [Myxococcota bacterium]
MIREVLRGIMRQVGKVPLTRRALHSLSVASRGAGVAVLRARRIVPDTALGKKHPDRKLGSAMTTAELARELKSAMTTLRFVHMSEAIEALAHGDRLREGCAVLTFDESFAATAELALPVCRALGVPATFFVTTGHLDGVHTLWDEEVRSCVEQIAPAPIAVSWIDRVLRTDTAPKRASATRRLLLSLAALDEERLGERLAELFVHAGGRPAVNALDRMLTTAEVAALSRDALVTFGAHGHRHVSVANAPPASLEDELKRPRALLREIAGDSFVDVMSFPFGRPPYVDEHAIHEARCAGYRAAFTAEPGVARPGDHMFRLPRLPIGPTTSGVAAYELQGTFDAVDELVMVASGERARLDESLHG